MNDERCGTCRSYDLDNERTHNIQSCEPLHKDDYEAQCRRFPPVRGDADYFGNLVGMNVLRDAYSWPTVQTIAWCGEWRRA